MKKEYTAKIFKSGKRRFDCRLDDTHEIVSAIALREVIKSNHPVVGDNVYLSPGDSGADYQITGLLERENEIYRRIVRENKKRVIAANIDVMFIVTSVSKPDYKSGLIDRYLLRAMEWEIPAVIIFNKMDEFKDQFDLALEKFKYEELLKAQTFCLSSSTPEKYADTFKALKKKLQGKTAICLGQSGVGKSRFITALSDGKVELLSRELAKGILKGAHTTTWAEMIDCDQFLLVDSPGIRSLSVLDIHKDELASFFPDLEEYFHQCQFKDCHHTDDSKGCSFHQLSSESKFERAIKARLQSYLRMRDEVESVPEWDKNSS